MRDYFNCPKLLLPTLLVASLVCVAFVFLPALDSQAICIDDNMYLVNNPLVQNPSLESVGQFSSEILEPSSVGGYYQPLTMISLMYDYAFGGSPGNLMPFHRTSLVLHTANVALVIVILYMLFGKPWVAVGLGLVFGLHPMVVETIVWVSERKTVLSAFFALSSLLLYLYYSRNRNWEIYLACVGTYILGMLSKPTVILLPVIMVLIDVWPLGRIDKKILSEKIPLFLIGTLFAIITLISQGRTASVSLPDQKTIWEIPALICHNIVFYLSKMVWPVNLTCHYPMPSEIDMACSPMLAGFIGTSVIVLLLVFSLRWTKTAMTSCLIFFIAILPTMHVIGFTNVIAASKFVYWPSIGLLIGLASLLAWLWKTKICRIFLVIFFLTVTIAEGHETRNYLSKWQDTISHYEYMLTVTPDAVGVYNNLGLELMMRKKFSVAVEHFQKALSIAPGNATTHYNFARVLRAQGKLEPAITHYRQAITISPDNIQIMNDLATTYKSMGKLDDAIVWLKKTVEINPEVGFIHNNLAIAYAQKGLSGASLRHFKKSANLLPNSDAVLRHTAWILATHPDEKLRSGKEAIHFAEKAAALTKYRDIEVLDILAAVYAENGDYKSAVEIAQRGINLASTVREQIVATGIQKRLSLYKQESPYRTNISNILYGPGY